MVEIGTEIGDIIHVLSGSEGEDYYKLVSAPITKIEITKNGTRYFAPKSFLPICAEEIEDNTKWMQEVKALFVGEPFLCVGDLKERAEKWCKTHKPPKEE